MYKEIPFFLEEQKNKIINTVIFMFHILCCGSASTHLSVFLLWHSKWLSVLVSYNHHVLKVSKQNIYRYIKYINNFFYQLTDVTEESRWRKKSQKFLGKT